MNTTTATPAQIDTRIAEIQELQASARLTIARYTSELHRAAGDTHTRVDNDYGWGMDFDQALALAAGTPTANTINECLTALADLDTEMRPLVAEYRRRGGWTRAYLVANADGHVHSTMNCQTCNRGKDSTRFEWLTGFSGATEADIVDAAGWRACTSCFPTAPLGDERSLPTRMFSQAERDVQAAREARDAAKAKRDADRIAKALTADGSEFTVRWEANGRTNRESFKTAKAAMQWVVQYKAWNQMWRGQPQSDERVDAYAEVMAALAEKNGVPLAEVEAEVEKKVAAKMKRDSR